MILAKLILHYNILNSNICSLDAKLPFFVEKDFNLTKLSIFSTLSSPSLLKSRVCLNLRVFQHFLHVFRRSLPENRINKNWVRNKLK